MDGGSAINSNSAGGSLGTTTSWMGFTMSWVILRLDWNREGWKKMRPGREEISRTEVYFRL